MLMTTVSEVATLTERALCGHFAPVGDTPELVYRMTNRMLGEISGFNEFNYLHLSRYPVSLDFLSDRLKDEHVMYITSDFDDNNDPVIVYVLENSTREFTDHDTGVTYLRARTYWFNPLNDDQSRFLTLLYIKRANDEYFRV